MSATATAAPDESASVGLAPGMRYRCNGCGNLTRFDVRISERATRFWHVSVAGVGQIESVDTASRDIEAVTCRWCGSADSIVTEPAPLQTESAHPIS